MRDEKQNKDRQEDGEHEIEIAHLKIEIAHLKEDCMTLALRLFSEDEYTFAPETKEVMDRWRPKCIKKLQMA